MVFMPNNWYNVFGIYAKLIMGLKILLAVLGSLLLASGIFLATTKFRSDSDSSGSITVSSVIKATDSAKLNEEPKKETTKEARKPVGEVSGVTNPNIAQLPPQQNQSPLSNNSQMQTTQPESSQNPAYQFNFELAFNKSNSPSEKYCYSERSYFDSTYQSDVAAENRDYRQRKRLLREDLARRGLLFSGLGSLGLLEVEHKARLDRLKREYDRNVANLVNEGCNF